MLKTLFILFFLIAHSYFNAQLNPDSIDIVRGEFGTTHIFAKTDKEVAYGLAWAHAEDDFKTIQETFLPSKYMMGRYKGKEGVQGNIKSINTRSILNIDPEFEGWFNIMKVLNKDGNPLSYTIHQTMMRINLEKPLKSKESFEFSIDWW